MTLKQFFANAPVTLILMVVILGLFIVQIGSGVNIDNPTSEDLYRWGANFFPSSFADEPWRLVTSAFLHIGLMHLMFNTFALFYFGQVAERHFGSVQFLALFLLSAIGGNLLNGWITWQAIEQDGLRQIGQSAGASGGIMGLGMALLTIEACRYVMQRRAIRRYAEQSAQSSSSAPMPPSLKANAAPLKGLALIMGINLAYGFVVPGIDNAGHIGGALTGMVLALALVWGILSQSKHPNNHAFLWQPWLAIIGLTLAFIAIWWTLATDWQTFMVAHS